MSRQTQSPKIPISYPSAFYDFLQREGLPVDEIFQEAGIDIEWFDDPNQKISFAQYIAISKKGIEVSQNHALGLAFGSYLSLQSHNNLGFAIQSSRNFSDAARLVCQYSCLRFPVIHISYTEEKGSLALVIEDRLNDPELHLYNVEAVVAGLYRGATHLQMMDYMYENGENPGELALNTSIDKIEFEYPKPAHVQGYYDIFSEKRVAFNMGVTRILYNKEILEKPFSFGNQISFKLAEAQCQAELLAVSDTESITTKTQHIMLSDVGQFPNLSEVANQLNMSSRALSRRLKEDGTSFQTIVDDVRKQLSIKYLKTTDLTISEIAYRLNYEQPTNFTRAFKKWTNKSPKDFRS